MIKRGVCILSLVLCWMLACPAQASELIRQEQIVADEVNYKTTTVEKGDLIKTVTAQAGEYHPVSVTVTYDGNQAVFVENLVRKGDMVKKGDPITRVTVTYDHVALTQQQLNYTRALESYEEGKASYDVQIAQLQDQVNQAADDYSRACAEIELQKLNIRRDQYCYQQERALNKQLEALNEQQEQLEKDVIYAPCDGEITDIRYMYAGESIYKDSYICQIYNPAIKLLAVNHSELRYGMDVTISTGSNKDRVEMPGRVVAAGDILPDSGITYALVEIGEGGDQEDIIWRNIKVSADHMVLRNVLIIPKDTWELSGGRYYVQKMSEDGIPLRRIVTCGVVNGKEMWVVQGLNEGDVIIKE